MSLRRAMTGVGFGVLILTLAVLARSSFSCSGSLVEYEPYPVYPLRSDTVVIANPTNHPTAPAPPGELDLWIRQHPSRGGKLADPQALNDSQKATLATTLESLFGTPAAPIVNSNRANALGLSDVAELAESSKLYRRHCSNCHGLTGEGRAPAGLFVYPHPRDFRLGKTKFGSTADGTPTRNDLHRVIKVGVPGTSMPPFQLADDRTVQLLVTATIHLSLRGEVEAKLIEVILSEDPPDNLTAEAKTFLDRAITRWESAREVESPRDVPPSSDERIRRGQQLLISTKAGCLSCHDDYGRRETYRFDIWGTAARVANLTEREYRGGAEPEAVFRRVKLGVPAVGMPAQSSLSDDELWDIVWFLKALPKPNQLPADVREKVYPKP